MDLTLKIKQDKENPYGENFYADLEITNFGSVIIYESDEIAYSIDFEQLLCLYKTAKALKKAQKKEFASDQKEQVIQELYKSNLLIEKQLKRLPWKL